MDRSVTVHWKAVEQYFIHCLFVEELNQVHSAMPLKADVEEENECKAMTLKLVVVYYTS